MTPIFRIDAPSAENLEDFHKDGYVAIPEVFTEEALSGLTDEVLNMEGPREYLRALDEGAGQAERSKGILRQTVERQGTVG